MLKGFWTRWFGGRTEEPVAHVGGGGANPDPGLPHECPPAGHSSPAIAPGVSRPDWPTPNYIRELGGKIRALQHEHPELYEEWDAHMQDYLATDKVGHQPRPSPNMRAFIERHKTLFDPGEA